MPNFAGTANNDTFTGDNTAESISGGTGGADNLHGGGGNDTILGNTGNDSLYGDAGNDSLRGGANNDSLLGGQGNDYLNGDADNDTLSGDLGNDTIVGGAGTDRANFSGSFALDFIAYQFTLSGQNVTIVGGSETDLVQEVETIRFSNGVGMDWNGSRWIGTDGTILMNSSGESYTGSSGANVIQGMQGSDTINGGAGNDTLYGGDGNDSLLGGDGDDSINGQSGNDSVFGEAGNDTLHGGQDTDLIDGGSGNDVIYGDVGNDNIAGQSGNDTIYGNDGTDTAYYTGIFDLSRYTLFFSGQNLTLADSLAGGDGTDVTQELENIRFSDNQGISWNGSRWIGTDASIILSASGENFTGSTSSERIRGQVGNDEIHGGSGDDTITGGGGNDDIYGDGGNDVIDGETGNDIIHGGQQEDDINGNEGDDSILGDLGNDTLHGGQGNDTIDAGDGDDLVFGDNGEDVLHGGAGNDQVNGGNDDDELYGDDGDDNISGFGGNDLVGGGLGTDYYWFNAGILDLERYHISFIGQTVTSIDTGGEDGTDTILNVEGLRFADGTGLNYNASGNFWTIEGTSNHGKAITSYNGSGFTGTALADEVFGQSGADNISGGGGNDTISGNGGQDTIDGGDGSDSITGGIANDSLMGGDGDDTINGNQGQDTISGQGGNDSLRGGQQSDYIEGGDGNDRLYGDKGNDTLAGGAGADRYVFSGEHSEYAIDVVNNSGMFTTNITHNVVDGEGVDIITGVDEFDFLEFAGGKTRQWNGTEWGSLTIDVTEGVDSVSGGVDDEVINDTNEDRKLSGGGGADTILGNGGDDTINGNQGNDSISGGDGNDLIHGGKDNDFANGNQGQDTVFGDMGNDTVRGGQGNDTLFGSDGEDLLYGDNDDDFLNGNGGEDTLDGGAGQDQLQGGKQDDTVLGGAGDDKLDGDLGNNLLIGDGILTESGIVLAPTADRGDDLFVISRDDEGITENIIADFEVGRIKEKVDIRRVTESEHFENADFTITQQGSNAVVTFANDQTVILEGVNSANLSAKDFLGKWSATKTLNIFKVGAMVDHIENQSLGRYSVNAVQVQDNLTHFVVEGFVPGNPGNADFSKSFNIIDLTSFGLGSTNVMSLIDNDAQGNARIELADGRTITIKGVSESGLTADNFLTSYANPADPYLPVLQSLKVDWNTDDLITSQQDASKHGITFDTEGNAAYVAKATTVVLTNQNDAVGHVTVPLYSINSSAPAGSIQVIEDYDPNVKIDLANFTISDISELGLSRTLEGDTVIDLGRGRTLVVKDVLPSELTEDNFVGFSGLKPDFVVYKPDFANYQNVEINDFGYSGEAFIDLSDMLIANVTEVNNTVHILGQDGRTLTVNGSLNDLTHRVVSNPNQTQNLGFTSIFVENGLEVDLKPVSGYETLFGVITPSNAGGTTDTAKFGALVSTAANVSSGTWENLINIAEEQGGSSTGAIPVHKFGARFLSSYGNTVSNHFTNTAQPSTGVQIGTLIIDTAISPKWFLGVNPQNLYADLFFNGAQTKATIETYLQSDDFDTLFNYVNNAPVGTIGTREVYNEIGFGLEVDPLTGEQNTTAYTHQYLTGIISIEKTSLGSLPTIDIVNGKTIYAGSGWPQELADLVPSGASLIVTQATLTGAGFTNLVGTGQDSLVDTDGPTLNEWGWQLKQGEVKEFADGLKFMRLGDTLYEVDPSAQVQQSVPLNPDVYEELDNAPENGVYKNAQGETIATQANVSEAPIGEMLVKFGETFLDYLEQPGVAMGLANNLLLMLQNFGQSGSGQGAEEALTDLSVNLATSFALDQLVRGANPAAGVTEGLLHDYYKLITDIEPNGFTGLIESSTGGLIDNTDIGGFLGTLAVSAISKAIQGNLDLSDLPDLAAQIGINIAITEATHAVIWEAFKEFGSIAAKDAFVNYTLEGASASTAGTALASTLGIPPVYGDVLITLVIFVVQNPDLAEELVGDPINTLTEIMEGVGVLLFGGDDHVFLGNDSPNVMVHDTNSQSTDTGAGDDVFFGFTGENIALGGHGNDILFGGPVNDALLGGWDNDTFKGNGGDDYMVGGSGKDVLFGDAGNDVIWGGDTQLFVETQPDYANTGADDADVLQGGAGNDVLLGGAGNDTLDGGAGNDILIGELGNNLFVVGIGAGSLDAIRDFDPNDDRVDLSAFGSSANVQVAAGNRTIHTAGNESPSINPDDLIYLRDNASASKTGVVVTLTSASGTQELFLEGADITRINKDVQFVYDNSGSLNDDPHPQGDIMEGATPADDTLVGTSGADTIDGLDGDDSINGNDGNDQLYGGGGNDSISAGNGNDSVYGNDGNDLLHGDAGDDYVNGNGGYDTVYGDSGNDTVHGGQQNDTVYGGSGSDEVHGSRGNDVIYGDGSADTLYGDDGNDGLTGGSGNDALYGGNGFDVAHFSGAVANYTVGTGATTTVTDNAGTDGSDQISGIEQLQFSDSTLTWNGSSWEAPVTNTAPVAADDTASVQEDTATVIDVLINDADLEDGAIAPANVSIATGPSHGTAQVNGNGTVTYTPTSGYLGDDSFVYEVEDSEGLTDSATVNLTVGATNQQLTGTSGADTLSGASGNDIIDGAAGNDSVSGNNGNDSILGSAGADTLAGGTGSDTIDGGTENDVISGGADADSVSGADGDDTVTGDAGADTLSGGTGQDNLDGGADNDSLQGNDGNDTLIGGTENDTLDGGAGADSLNGGGGNDSILGADGNDTLTGSTEDDTLDGGAGTDSLDGGAGNDSLLGSTEDDTITGGAGNDTINGGAGTDKARYSAGLSAYSVGVASGTTTVTHNSGGTDGVDSLTNVELLEFSDNNLSWNGQAWVDGSGNFVAGNHTPTANDDTAQTSQNTAVNISVLANDSDIEDTITSSMLAVTTAPSHGSTSINSNGTITYTPTSGYTGSDSFVYRVTDSGGAQDTAMVSITINAAGGQTLTGTSGADTLTGGTGNDTLDGLDGNDYLYGNAGNDSLLGGVGTDFLTGGAGADTIDGGSDADYIMFSSAIAVNINLATGTNSGGDAAGDVYLNIENISGSISNDTLTGSAADNTILGSLGNDLIDGGNGNDYIDGGNGNNTINGGSGTDRASYYNSSVGVSVDLAAGTAVAGSVINDTLSSIEGLNGSLYNDNLTGNSSANSISAYDGNDTISGADGNDTLYGLIGNDSITGGNGNDFMLGDVGIDTLVGNAGADTLTGGSEADIFVYTALSDSTASSKDRITDFVHLTDDISLVGLGFTGIQSGAASGTVLGYSASGGITTIVNAAGTFSLGLTGTITLTSADFIFS